MARQGAFAHAEQPEPKPDATAQAHFRDRYEQLQAARRDSDHLFATFQQDATQRHWPQYLLPTAEHVLQAFTDLRDDDKFWRELALAEGAFGHKKPDQRDVLAALELLNSDLVGLLDLMGYQPPPPSTTIATDLQLAAHDAISERDRSLRFERTKTARYQMALFTYHLRPLVEATTTTSRQSDEGRRLSRRLLAAVRKGSIALAPAAVAAAAASWIFPPAGVAGAAAAAIHGLTEGAREFTKQSIELGSASLVTAALGNQEATAKPEDIVLATEHIFHRSMLEAEAVANWLSEQDPGDDLQLARQSLQGFTIEAMRWYYQLERARLAVEPRPGTLRSKMAAENAQRALRELTHWLATEEDYESLRERVELLRQARKAVEETLLTP